ITSMTAPVTTGPTASASGVNERALLIQQLDAIRAKPGDMTFFYLSRPVEGATRETAVILGSGQGFGINLRLGETPSESACAVDNTISNQGGGSAGTMSGHFVRNCQGPVVPSGQPVPWVRYSWADFTATKDGV